LGGALDLGGGVFVLHDGPGLGKCRKNRELYAGWQCDPAGLLRSAR
jgi:hypothetical protein